MRGHRLAGLLAAVWMGAAGQAFAAPQQPAAGEPAPPPRVTAGSEGLAIESGTGDFRLQVGVLLHVDGRFALEDDNEQYVNQFTVRRLRPYLRGRVGRHFEFYVNPDLAGGTLAVQDAYVDTIFSPAFRLRAGKAKTPFGFERLISASNMVFLERATPTALAPNRDIGIQVLGDLYGGRLTYLAGVMNGVADGGSSDTETNDGKDVAGRLVVKPFATRPASSALRNLGVGFSAMRGEATGASALPAFRTQTLQQPFWSYASGPSPAVADGTRTRYSPSVWWLSGPFAGWTEYVHTEAPIRRADVIEDIAHDAWQVAGSWVLTGEAATDSGTGLRPRHNFDFGHGHWGAFQVAARFHALTVDERAVTLGLGAPGASRKTEAWTLGLRWYVTGNLWYTVNFERTVFDDDPEGPRHAENGLAFRTQVAF